MADGLLDLIFVLILLAPIGGALGSGIMMWWWAAAGRGPQASTSTRKQAAVSAVGLFPDGSTHRLRLTNKGEGLAHDVRAYINQKPISAHRDGAASEPHPCPQLSPGQTISYQYDSGLPTGRNRVLVRIEWDDATGGDVEEKTIRVS